jgi:ABC-2 type transport system ATP-binding protein
MATVMTASSEDGVSALLSSHVLAELEWVTDYFISVSRGREQGACVVKDLIAGHRMVTRPTADADWYGEWPVVHLRRVEAEPHLLVRDKADGPVPPCWETHPVGLEELALAHLRELCTAALLDPARGRDAESSEVTR